MKVSELIAILKKYPEDMELVLDHKRENKDYYTIKELIKEKVLVDMLVDRFYNIDYLKHWEVRTKEEEVIEVLVIS